MSKPMIRIHNSQTNEIVDREMNDDEFTQWQNDKADFELQEKLKAETVAKKAAAEAKLAALGLTADDLKALGLG